MDYQGEIGVILYNTSKNDYVICPGDKIAQLVFMKPELDIKLVKVESFDHTTERGGQGFGHSDKK